MHITDEAEACAAVLLACRNADELKMDLENPVFQTAIRSRNIFIGYSPDALLDTAAQYYEQAGNNSIALIDAALGAIREQTRLPLFYHCLDVILANGVVTPREHQVFQHLKGKFKIDDETAFQAMEVLVAKSRL